MKLKINKSIILFAILFIAGLSLLLYPFVANQWNTYRQSKLMTTYDETVAEMESSGKIDYEQQWSNAHAYNDGLLPTILPDSFAVAEATGEDNLYMSCLNLTGDGIMGRIEIPKINVKIPIFHTTEEEVLQKAAGHLEGSSLPVGGESTHAVISAHRGLPSATLFTDLDKMEKGDHFLLYILDDILCYQVDKITVIEPEDTKDLAVENGQDLVTLLTCTPYSVNSHRLLVRGHRVDYVESEIEEVPTSMFGVSPHTSYLLWVIIGLLITAVVIFILYKKDRKRKREEAALAPLPSIKPKDLPDPEIIDVKGEEKPSPPVQGVPETQNWDLNASAGLPTEPTEDAPLLTGIEQTRRVFLARKQKEAESAPAPEMPEEPKVKPARAGRREYKMYTDNDSFTGYKDYTNGGKNVDYKDEEP